MHLLFLFVFFFLSDSIFVLASLFLLISIFFSIVINKTAVFAAKFCYSIFRNICNFLLRQLEAQENFQIPLQSLSKIFEVSQLISKISC